jgi:hypothetical protein
VRRPASASTLTQEVGFFIGSYFYFGILEVTILLDGTLVPATARKRLRTICQLVVVSSGADGAILERSSIALKNISTKKTALVSFRTPK